MNRHKEQLIRELGLPITGEAIREDRVYMRLHGVEGRPNPVWSERFVYLASFTDRGVTTTQTAEHARIFTVREALRISRMRPVANFFVSFETPGLHVVCDGWVEPRHSRRILKPGDPSKVSHGACPECVRKLEEEEYVSDSQV